MEASAIPAPTGLARTRLSIGAPLLRVRTDEQLVALFRAGNNDAFRVIYDRYRQRLFAYTRQMLPASRQDAEDALQDVFVRAFNGLLANDRELALRAWLYRIAHNRCIDELRRPPAPAPEVMELVRPPVSDPIAEAEQRESLRRLIADVRRLPDQQRSALLMRELAGMTYNELSEALGVSIPAVKSLLVRARIGLAAASEARDAACSSIREELVLAHDRGVRPTGLARRHMHDCAGCRAFRLELRGASKQFAALAPALGPLGFLAKLLGVGSSAGGSAAASSGAAAGGGAAAATGVSGTVASAGVLATGVGHVATVLAAAVVTAGGAVAIQHTILPSAHHRAHHRAIVASAPDPVAQQASPAAPPSYVEAAVAPSEPTAAHAAPQKPTVPAHAQSAMQPAPANGANPATATVTDVQATNATGGTATTTASSGTYGTMTGTGTTSASGSGGAGTSGIPASGGSGTSGGSGSLIPGAGSGSGGSSSPTVLPGSSTSASSGGPTTPTSGSTQTGSGSGTAASGTGTTPTKS